MCPWILWWVCHHQGDLMWSWWWWIDLARWHTSCPLKKVPQPKKHDDYSSHMCLSIMVSPRTLCQIKIPSSQISFVASHPKFFKRLNGSLKVKTTEEKKVGVCSLARNTSGVKRCVGASKWGLGQVTNGLAIHLDLHIPNNKLVIA